jgi:hypothetical protein
MNKGSDEHEHDLDSLFAEVRAQGQIDSTVLQAKVFGDAIRLQPQANGLRRAPVPTPRFAFFNRLAAALGGKAILAGIGAAAISGVLVGFAQPASLTAMTGSLFAEAPLDQLDLFPSVDDILTEG